MHITQKLCYLIIIIGTIPLIVYFCNYKKEKRNKWFFILSTFILIDSFYLFLLFSYYFKNISCDRAILSILIEICFLIILIFTIILIIISGFIGVPFFYFSINKKEIIKFGILAMILGILYFPIIQGRISTIIMQLSYKHKLRIVESHYK